MSAEDAKLYLNGWLVGTVIDWTVTYDEQAERDAEFAEQIEALEGIIALDKAFDELARRTENYNRWRELRDSLEEL